MARMRMMMIRRKKRRKMIGMMGMMMRKRMVPSRPSWKYGCGSRMLTQDLYLNSSQPTSFQKLVRLP